MTLWAVDKNKCKNCNGEMRLYSWQDAKLYEEICKYNYCYSCWWKYSDFQKFFIKYRYNKNIYGEY